MPLKPSRPRVPPGLIWRIALTLVVLALALTAFGMGVGVSDRDGVPTEGFATRLYYAIGLFVLGGMDLGVPTGGPPLGRTLLWIAYFTAPALTAGAVAEGLLRVWNPGWWRLRGLRDHIVVGGMGQVGTLYLEALRREDPRRRVLTVDLRASPGDGHSSRVTQDGQRTLSLAGDLSSPGTRSTMKLERAAGVVLTTGSDLTNLETATDILAEYPHLSGRVLAHVADVGLEKTVEGTRPHEYGVFNAHRIAADELVRERLSVHFRRTDAPDVVIIAGFGRFGQTILEVLQRQAAGEFSAVVLVDRSADALRRQFAERVGFVDGYRCVTIGADLGDPATWGRVAEAVESALPAGGTHASVILVLGTDDDALNLRTAMTLRQREPDLHIVVRAFRDSSLTRRLSEDGAFHVFGVSRLLRDALGTWHRRWFMERGD